MFNVLYKYFINKEKVYYKTPILLKSNDFTIL